MNLELPDQYVTLSGLVHDLAKEIPKVGKIFYYKDIKLQIISRTVSRINKVKVSNMENHYKDNIVHLHYLELEL